MFNGEHSEQGAIASSPSQILHKPLLLNTAAGPQAVGIPAAYRALMKPGSHFPKQARSRERLEMTNALFFQNEFVSTEGVGSETTHWFMSTENRKHGQ